MTQNEYEAAIEAVMRGTLDDYTSSLSFNELWHKYRKSQNQRPGLSRLNKISKIAIALIFVLFIAGIALKPIIDKTDYPFVNDPAVIGRWQTVDIVEKIDQFTPGQRFWNGGNFYLTGLAFSKAGKVLWSVQNSGLCPGPFTWTRGLAVNRVDKTASKYEIKAINDADYMFLEWKSGDYIYDHQKPPYIVLKKVDNLDYSKYQPKITGDKIDYPFVDDPRLPGKWKSVDIVSSIDEFTPGSCHLRDVPYLQNLDIAEGGKISGTTLEKELNEDVLTWTKGLIINQQARTAGRYEIKDMEGSSYLFFEWKTGDYVYRGVKPDFYVFQKVE